MKHHIALLRGINVGGNKKVEMATLKKVFEDMGYTDVSTYINSGNVLFSAGDTEIIDCSKIERVLANKFGFAITCLVRDQKNITTLARAVPAEWKNDAEQKTDILFLQDEYDSKKSIELLSLAGGIDEVLYIPGALVWHINRSQYTKSGMNKFIGTVLYKHMTARNINTVRKLAELLKKRGL
jgi:uncharacterized protein (DUF1697 family)